MSPKGGAQMAIIATHNLQYRARLAAIEETFLANGQAEHLGIIHIDKVSGTLLLNPVPFTHDRRAMALLALTPP